MWLESNQSHSSLEKTAPRSVQRRVRLKTSLVTLVEASSHLKLVLKSRDLHLLCMSAEFVDSNSQVASSNVCLSTCDQLIQGIMNEYVL